VSRKSSAPDVDRRAFFSVVAATGAVSLVGGVSAQAAATATPTETTVPTPSGTLPPSAAVMAAEQQPPAAEPVFVQRSGSDYMVDCLKTLDIDYITALPGSSFRGLHESIINYGGNTKPELLTCLHEEMSVAIAHGYAKIAGKPMAAVLHGVVGVQHGSMAVYNAWCDRVPILMLAGNNLDSTKRREGAEWDHSALDNAAIVRDFTKWDAQPVSLAHYAESLMRAYGLAITPPSAPVLLMLDTELQERPIPEGRQPIPALNRPTPPVGDSAALAEAAKLLVTAQNPVVIADALVRTQTGMDHLVALAETLQAPVIDRYSRLNMPAGHYLNQTERGRALISEADVILGLELTDPWGVVNTLMDRIDRTARRVAKPGMKMISLTTHDLLIKANFQNFQRYEPVDLLISGDGETTLPYLLEAVKQALPASQQSALRDRGAKLRTLIETTRHNTLIEASYGWDASPITTARLCAEILAAIKDSDWALVGGDSQFRNFWPQKLWPMTKAYQFAGGAGGGGVGYCAPAAVGSALAHREHGRLVVNLQGDGDMMCCAGSLWTAVHHKIPLLTVMHNNRAYHQELMHVQRMADRHSRGITRAGIGTKIDDPPIDYAKLAQSMGMWAIGPITDPKDLGSAVKKAVDVVKQGEPALVDAVCQGR
jgi:thiamine pyrophosphate-dependent acetolactate synthase large subunit-like protein